MPRRSAALYALLLAAGCAQDAAAPGDADGGAAASKDLAAAALPDAAVAPAADLAMSPPDLAYQSLVQKRPYKFKIPSSYDPKKPWPLVVLLHGYSADGATQDLYFGLGAIVDQKGFLYAYPDGTQDKTGVRFWNATDACCDLYKSGVDDVAYVNAVIDDMSFKFNVDPKRVFLAGHSNGAFMSHRMACESSPRIAAIMALAGDNWRDSSRCQPTQPVSILQVHGDFDAVILYNGGSVLGIVDPYPSAHDSIGSWVAKNGCDYKAQAGSSLDLESVLFGNETTVEKWPSCRPGGAAELWTIRGGSHLPTFNKNWAPAIIDWLFAHPKP